MKEYTAAPLFMLDKAKGRHQWMIEFEKMPPSLDDFASLLDKTLQQLNSDYEAKRYKEISLQPLEIRVAREGTFYEWLRRKGKIRRSTQNTPPQQRPDIYRGVGENL